MKRSNVYAVIMAGGVGERFWPLSKESSPKQFLKVFTGEPMLLTTAKRIAGYIPYANMVVVTNKAYERKSKALFRKFKGIKIIGEPVGKNTAPAIAAAAALIERENPDGIMAVLSADHIIKPVSAFVNSLKLGAKIASQPGKLVCLGVPPQYPHTGLGHIEMGEKTQSLGSIEGFRVVRFVEKPPLDNAIAYTKSGRYLWNCGIFVWSVSTIMDAFKAHMKSLYEDLMPARKAKTRQAFDRALNRFYRKVIKESIDFGVLEYARDISVVKSPIDWSDVGSWIAYKDLFKADSKGNLFKGNVVDLESNNSLVLSDKGLTATYGLSDVFVIREGDALPALIWVDRD
jgi:mannose-1-phosphate guanylyltransferase